MAPVRQEVLPLVPAGAVPIGPVAALLEDGQGGGVVFVSGLATFAFDAGDVVGRRLAAVQLVTTKIASQVQVAGAFGTDTVSLWRWKTALASAGVAGLLPGKSGPKGPSKLTVAVVARIRELDQQQLSLRAIATATGVSTAAVRVALGRVGAGVGGSGRVDGCVPAARAGQSAAEVDGGQACADAPAQDAVDPVEPAEPGEPADSVEAVEAVEFAELVEPGDCGGAGGGLAVLPAPVPRTVERELARWGLLSEAAPEVTEGAQLPLAGLLLILPALAVTGLLEVFGQTYGRMRNGFYGLRATVLMMVFLAVLRDPRAEGATRINPADLGRMLGLDRAPEVKTLRRKLGELAGYERGVALQRNLAAAHAAARPQALGFLHVDGHVRAYFGTRDLPKTHIGRLHMAARATSETWIADASGDPVMVITAIPGTGLAAELVRLLPEVRTLLGPDRRATIIFDRGGWSAQTFAAIVDAGLDLITYRKGEFTPLPDTAFTPTTFTDPDGRQRAYLLAQTTATLKVGKDRALTLRQIHKKTQDGTQIPILTSRQDLDPAAVCWRLGGRWRQENYFKYARGHFALDALDSYADTDDDPQRLVPNPAKKHAKAAVTAAKTALAQAETALAAAIQDAAQRARRPGAGATAPVNPAATRAVTAAHARLDQAKTDSRTVRAYLPLAQIRPDARVLDEERKLLTHTIRMAAYNAETTLTHLLHGHYTRADDEARALIREAMTLSGDLQIHDTTLHVRLNPATNPRRTRALNALCQQLTTTHTTYPDTNLTIHYTIKNHPNQPTTNQ